MKGAIVNLTLLENPIPLLDKARVEVMAYDQYVMRIQPVDELERGFSKREFLIPWNNIAAIEVVRETAKDAVVKE